MNFQKPLSKLKCVRGKNKTRFRILLLLFDASENGKATRRLSPQQRKQKLLLISLKKYDFFCCPLFDFSIFFLRIAILSRQPEPLLLSFFVRNSSERPKKILDFFWKMYFSKISTKHLASTRRDHDGPQSHPLTAARVERA